MSAVWLSQARLEKIVGPEAAQTILKAYAGQGLYIRMKSPNPALVDLIGVEAATALSREVGGMDVIFPSGASRQTAKERLVPLLESGASVRDAAAEAGCSTRFASEVRKDLGLSRPRPKPKASKEIILSMIRSGRKDAEIAQACGVPQKRVWCLRLELQREART